jgi:hypothetical protein
MVTMLRILGSGRTWLQLREAFGLDGAESGPLVAWVIGALLAEVRRGNPPPARQDQRGKQPPARAGRNHPSPSSP